MIDGKLYTPNQLLESYEFDNCADGVIAACEKACALRQEIENKEYQKVVDLIYSFKAIGEGSAKCLD